MDLDDFERIFGEPVRFGPHTLDSPVRYEVWRDFALSPGESLDLLLEPTPTASPNQVARVLLEALRHAAIPPSRAHPAIADEVVVVTLDFRGFLRVVVPLTEWSDLVQKLEALSEEALVAHLEAARTGNPLDPAQGLEVPGNGHLTLDQLERLRWFLLLTARIGHQTKRGLRSDTPAEVRAMARWLKALGSPFVSARKPIEAVSRNRSAQTSVVRSRATIKADAAQLLFKIDASEIAWAVVDSGIEARHPAFAKDPTPGTDYVPFEETPAGWDNHTRIARTYDLVHAREWLEVTDPHEADAFDVGDRIDAYGVVNHDATYSDPYDVHGTHVAGILGANWPEGPVPLVGMCPRITLYDFRVLGADSRGDEFSIVTALNHILRLNREAGRLVIMGVNLSLSLPHDVANYACGWTPICRACDRLVDSGVVVVVSAGNTGFRAGPRPRLADGTNYLPISVTDPGNAAKVITVGSTHREFPYRYGVSYFSARGPTADGRPKPDLLAPGEGILSPVGRHDYISLDGTSQAAPHVSGAAALLLARYPELIEQPLRVKQILCDMASDLGRDRAFQGHGLVDVLRALQSI